MTATAVTSAASPVTPLGAASPATTPTNYILMLLNTSYQGLLDYYLLVPHFFPTGHLLLTTFSTDLPGCSICSYSTLSAYSPPADSFLPSTCGFLLLATAADPTTTAAGSTAPPQLVVLLLLVPTQLLQLLILGGAQLFSYP